MDGGTETSSQLDKYESARYFDAPRLISLPKAVSGSLNLERPSTTNWGPPTRHLELFDYTCTAEEWASQLVLIWPSLIDIPVYPTSDKSLQVGTTISLLRAESLTFYGAHYIGVLYITQCLPRG